MGIRLRDTAEVLIPARSADPANPRRRRPNWTLEPAETIPVRFQAQQSAALGLTTAGLENNAVMATWTGELPPLARLADGTTVDMVEKVTKAARIRWHAEEYSLEEVRPHRRGTRVRYLSVVMRKL